MVRQRVQFVGVILFSLSSIAYFPFANWISTTRTGTTLFLWLEFIYGIGLLAALPGVPALLVCLAFRRTRKPAAFWLLAAIVFLPCCVFGIVLGKHARRAGMQAFAERSRPLISAIEAYKKDHGAPPGSLKSLVPKYLPAVPATGMMAYPEFEYHVGNEAIDRFGNPWALTVQTPSGGINFDQMLYFPNQEYPTRGYGGGLERIDGWAYAHE